MRTIPHHTASQKWARKHGACEQGRRELGKRTIRKHWNTCPLRLIYQLAWIAERLGRETFADNFAQRVLYKEAIDRSYECFVRQPNRVRKTRRSMEAVMTRFNVHWPVEIL